MPDHPPRRALLFGAIGTLAETSHLQREAFNLAFRQSGLDWNWDSDTYRDLLHTPGGANRIATEARRRGETVDAAEIHSRKVANFRAAMLGDGPEPRPGVTDTIAAARTSGVLLGWVTTTGPDTVDLMLEGLKPAITPASFDLITSRLDVERPKPAPDIYRHALERLDVLAENAIAIEDTPESADAALAAGIPTIGFPGWAASDRAFPGGVTLVDRLSPEILTQGQAA